MALQAFPQEVLTPPSLYVCLDEVSPGTFHLLHSGLVPCLPRHLSQDLLWLPSQGPLASVSPSPNLGSYSSFIYSFSRPNPSVVSEKNYCQGGNLGGFCMVWKYLYFTWYLITRLGRESQSGSDLPSAFCSHRSQACHDKPDALPLFTPLGCL